MINDTFASDPVTLLRGQFILGTALPGLEDLGMAMMTIGDHHMWVGSGLPVFEAGPVTIVGIAATLSGRSLQDHFSSISEGSKIVDVAELALDLTGRFVVLAAVATGLTIVPDGMASKRVFLSVDGKTASSSEILLQHVHAGARIRSPAERNIVENPSLASREYATLGLYSATTGFRRLLPNRVANLSTGAIDLCSPATRQVACTVPELARTFRRNAAALSTLGSVELGLTAGFDSRLVLAAFDAEGLQPDTFTFVDGGSKKRADAAVAESVAGALGCSYEKIQEPRPDDRIVELLRRSQSLVRPIPHVLSQLTWLSQRKTTRLTVNGLGGEVSRSRFGLVPRRIGRCTSRRVALGPNPYPHDFDAFDEWWDDRFATEAGQCHLPATTLHHWEQRVAIWGAQFMAEKDLFVDEVSAFSSGRVQQQLVSFPQRQRSSLTSALFTQLIEELSPTLASLEPPERSPWKYRIHDATPLPRLLRTVRPGWGPSS